MIKQNITILLARPRGFCAGVTRAIEIVEKAIIKFGAPVYVRHEIVHNTHVVRDLEKKGAIFVQEISEVPEGKIVIFSAHGVPACVIEETERRGLTSLDATCPLVEKAHKKVKKLNAEGRKVILIGHAGHPEVVGTMGQLPKDEIILLENEDDIDNLSLDDFKTKKFACVTQTTLSVDETLKITSALKEKIPDILLPKQNDICYATTNRQAAVKQIASLVDMLIVIGSPNSSNSRRLVEVASKAGCKKSILIQDVLEINWKDLDGISSLGITAGASAPERLVLELIEEAKQRFNVSIKEVKTCEETLHFKLPKVLE